MRLVDCRQCPLRQRKIFTPFTEDELAYMQRFKVGELTLDAGRTFLQEGSSSPQLFTVLSGMGIRYKLLENGARQVVNFLLPGDFAGLQAAIMGEMKHSAEATTEVHLCVFDRAELWNLFRRHPLRAYDLTWLAAMEEHYLGEAVVSIGQRDARQRVAWSLLKLFQRLRAVGMGVRNIVPLPYRQQDLADALGLSLVHTNKTLARLRNDELASWAEGKLRIDDPSRLAAVAVMDLEAPEQRPLM
ncbi:MAG TPA: Crp/Fnr family transcriptional regulator [Albidovulum sp.]|uniref:Crp/Fnr family transcriptional regulator n=1 Tax=Albidovulum sp. TaxID=1872424 RepID=UPI002BC99961|nr:Crp/Fnr family transcriptional regulator [Albidovulum sp.]